MPVAVTMYANMAVDGRPDITFGTEYKGTNRLSYFAQAIVSRKINDYFSVQAAASFTHYNCVDVVADHDKVGLHFSGRAKFSPQSSFVFNYDLPLDIKGIYSVYGVDAKKSKPNLVIGYEHSSGFHSFQIVLGTSGALLPQETIMFNQNDYTKKEMAFGFLITRVWNF